MSALPDEEKLLKLDLGCGPNPKEGFTGVDIRDFSGVSVVHDLRKPWPWGDSTVSEAHCSHFLEHLTGAERIHFFNELWRVLERGGKCTIITPHWASNRAYGDPTHLWPPVSEMAYMYVSKEWREKNAPHVDGGPDGYTCDLAATWGYSMHQELVPRNFEYQSHALKFWKEAAADLIATVVAVKKE